MSDIPESLQYTEEHEYIRPSDDDDVVFIGITDYAQGELGDVVYVELPEVGTTFKRMDEFGTIEAVKAVSQLFCPLAGEVVEINPDIDADPSIINRDPYAAGWMIKLRVTSPSEMDQLLSAADYAQHIGE